MTAASTTRISSFRPSARIVRGTLWRAVVIDIAAAAVALNAPAWVRTPLSTAAALVVVVYFLRRSRRRGLADGILTAVGVGVVALMLLALVLNLLQGGINGLSWGVGVGVVELALLFALTYWRPPVESAARERGWRSRIPVAPIAWTVAVGAVLATALVWSTSSYNTTHAAPLALAAMTSTDSAVVTVSAGSAQGPFELRSVSGAGVVTVLFRGIRVGPGQSKSFTVVTSNDTRTTIELVKSGSTTSVRHVILDNTLTTGGSK